MKLTQLIAITSLAAISACDSSNSNSPSQPSVSAPGAPGDKPNWAFAGKTGIGTSYEQYINGEYTANEKTGEVSKVWFSIAEGVLTETMYGLIHQAQLKDMQLAIITAEGVDYEIEDTRHTVSYLATDTSGRPLAPAYKLINHDLDNQYRIEKQFFTDPDQQVLWQRITIEAKQDDITPVLIANPHISNTGWDDQGHITENGFSFYDANTAMAVMLSQPATQLSVGFKGESDAYTDLQDNSLDWQYPDSGGQAGNIIGSAVLPTLDAGERYSIDIVIGFGKDPAAAKRAAAATLEHGYQSVLDHYVGTGEYIGWQDYIASLNALPELASISNDNGKLAYSSALVLKVQEDKTHAGALIASLSNPWGDTVPAVESATGYKAVWPRDFYQCAMALLAIGDAETAKVAFEYLPKVQVSGNKHGNQGTGGWFYQKAEVDGTPEWVAVQLDQTAMPIMLGWQLWQRQFLSNDELSHWYTNMLKPAANFLAEGGTVNIDWNQTTLIPPMTQQERWEEQFGYSPSTIAAVIAGLVNAADIATHLGDKANAERYLAAADTFQQQLDAYTYTTNGVFTGHPEHYLRISQNTNPNDAGPLDDRNGRGTLNEAEIIDGGFLELVRYGIKSANDPKIRNTLSVIDDTGLKDQLRVRYEFADNGATVYSGWRRYGNDGYGEGTNNGSNYGAGGAHGGVGGGMSADQRGRVWPFLTGERGHYEIARGASQEVIKRDFISALEYFANEGLMLPEQVWDGVGETGPRAYQLGEGTNGATPLAWAHAEYLKLLRSALDGEVFDSYNRVEQRYQKPKH